ncbi:hypothetical protein CCB81_00020 [Armatimonadetes bacterium Uphvl-Ar2]|nr:hypothetical protein CCB81_00020 [Armatimonadetes bacterium Uphvl-Ar2]
MSERRGGVSTWSHSGLKNADAQTTGAGAIQATRVYDAFGAELSATGTWKGPFGYAGGFGYQEDSSGLKLLGHRYYDPTTGRFLSRDPIKDGRNWYVYAQGNAISNSDPNGLWAVPALIVVVAVVVVIIVHQSTQGPSKNPSPAGTPAPAVAGELGAAMEGAPAVLRTGIRMKEMRAMEEYLTEVDDASHKGKSDNFDTVESNWQNPDAYTDPDRYIPGASPPAIE